MTQSDISPPEDAGWAFQQVGEFLWRFARLERAVDAGLAKLLGLKGQVAEIVASSIPLAKKVDMLFSTEKVVAARPSSVRGDDLKRAKSGFYSLNDKRTTVAHAYFDVGPGPSVRFRHTVVSGGLKVKTAEWSAADFATMFKDMGDTEAAILRLVDEMKPYRPSLDFSDPRNSWMLGVI